MIVVKKMTKLFYQFWECEKVPEEWNENRVTLLHRGAQKSKRDFKNYRRIVLSNMVGQAFCAILNERLKKWIQRKSTQERTEWVLNKLENRR